MSEYKIYILSRDGRINFAYDFEGPDDLSVFEESKGHLDKCGIEIWQRARLVARIDKCERAAAEPNACEQSAFGPQQ